MFSKISHYFVRSFGELKKVSWPKQSDVIRLTIIVIISTGLAMLFITGLDWLLAKIINYFVIK